MKSKKVRKDTGVSVAVIQPRMLNVKAAAEYLGCTVWFMRTLAWEKKIPHVIFGNRLLFDKADIDRYVESQKVPAA
jgi:excisionase family DNA binding protein